VSTAANGGAASTYPDPGQESVAEIVTHVAQHDVIDRNMALRRLCPFDIATS